ncbi:hypothetical protein ACTXMH_04060 [Psychrobacter celer]|uniref:hypothetical protein n=1 Tax=Psychrobacter sp. Rd 27.2 TaxID=1926479 RepID=UPI00094719E9|nr:hypothetical protein [Psychrobacter sp. Rd 27.2]OLF41556.1 hypothetical protein BTV99_03345 [Psychrobacter sp. Rd 27.2]
MKKRYVTKAAITKIDKSKTRFWQSNNIYLTFFGVSFLLLLVVNACSSESFSENGSAGTEKVVINDKETKAEQNAREVKNNIRNSYARLASGRSDVCPKLIQEKVGSPVVERTAEVMVDDYCDYFLYAREGQVIAVQTDNRQLEALLIVPTLHNFANGDYQVGSYDKHVIRLSYNGATYKPENLVYDVAVTVSDVH